MVGFSSGESSRWWRRRHKDSSLMMHKVLLLQSIISLRLPWLASPPTTNHLGGGAATRTPRSRCVSNCLTYASTLSHLRRLNSPIGREGIDWLSNKAKTK
ncbi:RNA polymerase II second largest subunit [Carex littledalei]|uniref:RNA polymerase II second largest subunit n=1 Tax=Carex littledalei TaxID=544730 RepID=A0A833QN79_9POAL|nr:RNA polymerase II second largest subunit [Carex littledalei]